MGKVERKLEHAAAQGRGLLDIGQAAKSSGVSVKMIRHYEAIGLLKEVARTDAHYRIYNDANVHTCASSSGRARLGSRWTKSASYCRCG